MGIKFILVSATRSLLFGHASEMPSWNSFHIRCLGIPQTLTYRLRLWKIAFTGLICIQESWRSGNSPIYGFLSSAVGFLISVPALCDAGKVYWSIRRVCFSNESQGFLANLNITGD